MTFQTALNNLYANYKQYGVSKEFLSEQLRGGVLEHGFSVEAAYHDLRMVLAQVTGEHGLFSIDDVSAITGESRQELIERIEQYREELAAAGKNPDDYFMLVEPVEKTILFFPYGIPLD